MRRVETDRRQHGQQLAEEVIADPLALRRGPFLAAGIDDAFLREARQHDLVQELVLLADERVRLLAHAVEHLGGAPRVRAGVVQAELDAFLQPRDADLEELVEVRRHDGDEAQPLEERHRIVRRLREHPALEGEDAELAVGELGRRRDSSVHGGGKFYLPAAGLRRWDCDSRMDHRVLRVCYGWRVARQDTLAAVDLGSNSFHLEIGRVVDRQIYPLDAVREVVRLGGGLTVEKRIDRATQANALDALAKFAERLRGFPRQAVRAVGTNALRIAKNSPQFLREARAALGFPIEVISGREEARLIYIGVAHAMPVVTAGSAGKRRLGGDVGGGGAVKRRRVVAVGGGPTEFIIGAGLEPQLTESLYMGCVSYSLKYFPDGKIDKQRLKAAEFAARQELSSLRKQYRETGWEEAVGSSGTARSIENILRENGFAQEGITREGLERLRSKLIKEEKADADRIPGLRPNRAPVLPGGVAILSAVFDELGIDEMRVSDGALRHGVLYDLLGRFQHRDMREATVAQF